MICRICGTTSDKTKDWRPACNKYGGDVCGRCCLNCEDHVTWSGIWKCKHISAEQRKAAAAKRAQAAMNEELSRISKAYHRERRSRAKEFYIKQAKQRAKASAQQSGEFK